MPPPFLEEELCTHRKEIRCFPERNLKGWNGRDNFVKRMDLVRRIMILTIEYDWVVGLWAGWLPYSADPEGYFASV